MVIMGGVDRLGAVYATGPRRGLRTNYDYLRANLGIASQSGDGTVTGLFTPSDGGGNMTEPVTVLGFRRGPTLAGYWCRAVLSLEVPAGYFT